VGGGEYPLRVYQRAATEVLVDGAVLCQLERDEPRPLAGPRRLAADDALDGGGRLLLRLAVGGPVMLVIAAATAVNGHRLVRLNVYNVRAPSAEFVTGHRKIRPEIRPYLEVFKKEII